MAGNRSVYYVLTNLTFLHFISPTLPPSKITFPTGLAHGERYLADKAGELLAVLHLAGVVDCYRKITEKLPKSNS